MSVESITGVPIPLSVQLARDEEEFAKRNPSLVKPVQHLRKLVSDPQWVKEHRGLSIVAHEDRIVAQHVGSGKALQLGIEAAGTWNVYLITIP